MPTQNNTPGHRSRPRATCPSCGRSVLVYDGRLRVHNTGPEYCPACPGSGKDIYPGSREVAALRAALSGIEELLGRLGGSS